MGVPLGALLGVVLLITTAAVVTAVLVKLSRKEDEIPAAEYEVVGPPELPLTSDPITTEVNAAYASTSFNNT